MHVFFQTICLVSVGGFIAFLMECAEFLLVSYTSGLTLSVAGGRHLAETVFSFCGARHCKGDNLPNAGGDLPVFGHLCDKHAGPGHLYDGHYVARGEKGRLRRDDERREVRIEKRCDGKPWPERVSAKSVRE